MTIFATFMKTNITALSVLFLFLVPASAQSFQSVAPTAILVDYESGAVLYEKAADTLVQPGSTAKLMTAALVFRELAEGRLKLEDTLPISENAWRKGGGPSGGASMFAVLHSHVSVDDLLQGLLVQAGNDAAIALAEGIAGSEDAFATLMTRRARQIGMEKSTFTNSSGKDEPDQRVTAREMALLAMHVIRAYPQYYHYFSEKEFIWNKIRQTNRNPLLQMDMGADGLLTGDTKDGGYVFIGSAVQNGQRLIIFIGGLSSMNARAEEARRLLNWGFRSFEPKILFKAQDIVGTAKVFGGAQGDVDLKTASDVRILMPRTNGDRISGKIVYKGPLVAPVLPEQEVGSLQLYRGAKLVSETPLLTAEPVAVGTMSQRALDSGLELILDIFRQLIQKGKGSGSG